MKKLLYGIFIMTIITFQAGNLRAQTPAATRNRPADWPNDMPTGSMRGDDDMDTQNNNGSAQYPDGNSMRRRNRDEINGADNTQGSTTGNNNYLSTTGDNNHSSTTGDNNYENTTGNNNRGSTTGNNNDATSSGMSGHENSGLGLSGGNAGSGGTVGGK